MIDTEDQLEAVPGPTSPPGHARVVDQDIQRLAQCQECPRGLADRAQVGQVQGLEADLVAARSRGYRGDGGLALLWRAAGDVDAAATGSERARRGQADPRVTAGDQERLSG